MLTGQLREILNDQRGAAKETEALHNQQKEFDKQPNPKKNNELVEELKGQSDRQMRLAENTQKLQDRMEKVLRQQDKGNESLNQLSQFLKKAVRLDEKERAEAYQEMAKEARAQAEQQSDDDAKEALQGLAKELQQAANELAKGNVPEAKQAAMQKQAQKSMKQAQNAAAPAPVKNLKEAIQIGQDANLPDKIRSVSSSMADLDLNKARANQDEAIRNLEKMLAALEGQNDDGLDRLRRKQKNLAKAEENLDKLGKKTKNAQNLKDPKEKADELDRLAKEARENARELARLQEEKASKELNRAAALLEEAAEKTQQGQEAEARELENEANERIEQAQKDLEDFAEELAREQLARIADRLKGLKERQDAAVQRSDELQQRAIKTREWTRGLKQTLDAEKMTQEGMAQETRGLQEKIKEAKVFEHVMDKAAKAMEKAAEAIGQRKEEAAGRTLPKWSDDDLKDEERRHGDIVKLQKQAADRLQRLLDALKEDLQAAQEQQNQPMDGGGGEEQQGARPRPTDGIPPMAELKALKFEQLEVNERTKEFARLHPDPQMLNDQQRRDLAELEAEQRRLREIFAGMTTKKGDQP
jgi:hypothetical protein